MVSSRTLRLYRIFIIATVTAAVASGCTAFDTGSSSIGDMKISSPEPSVSSPDNRLAVVPAASLNTASPSFHGEPTVVGPSAVCNVIVLRQGGTPHSVQVPLQGGETVQTALERAGVAGRFRRANVHVLRRPDEPDQPMQKMTCKYNPSRSHIALHTDYALRPGDDIYVSPDLKGAVNSLTGGLLKRFGGR